MKSFDKKLFPALLFLLFVFNASTAQRFTGALLAGISATQVAGDGLAGYHKAGFVAGGSVYTKLSEKFALEMEIEFIQKGSKTRPDTVNYSFYRMSLNYIEVPLLIQYNYSKRFQFNAGISFGRLLSNKEEDAGGEITYTLPFEKNEYAFFGGMNFGFTEKFLLSMRISNSFLPIRKIGADPPKLQNILSGQYNTMLVFALKYRFLKENN